MDFDRAEIIAINGLSFIASNEKYLAGYLNLSGSDLNILRENIANPTSAKNVYASVLDYFLQNEKHLVEYAETYKIEPMDIGRARQLFPGAPIEGQ